MGAAALRWVRWFGTGLLAALASLYIRLVYRTTRWRVEQPPATGEILSGPVGVIVVTWHGRLFLAPAYPPAGKRSLGMVSRSRDGDLFASVLRRWGLGVVRGSSHDRAKRRAKGGAQAFAGALVELTGKGALIGITPDGPRGPARRVQPGAARLAAAAAVPVVAVGFSTHRGRVLRSWDRFLLPFPFGRGAIVWSEPLPPPRDDSGDAIERFSQRIEAGLDAVTDRADALCGRG